MATVTVYTAERMKAIEDASVVDGNVVDDNLILTRYDATTINAGNVRGAQGIQGNPGVDGEVTQAILDAAIAALKANVYASVVHAADENASRPTGYAGVIWFGTVQPLNMQDPDVVIRTDEAI